MDIAFRVIEERTYKNPVTRIFLLSDGKDRVGYQGIPDLVKQSKFLYFIKNKLIKEKFKTISR